MKTKKMLGFFTAAIMAAAALPVVSVGAVDAAFPGDVDQDGVITGHDSAMVSRALYEDPSALTEEQKALADYNGDGVIDETDLEAIHANEVFSIGDIGMIGGVTSDIQAAYRAILLYSAESSGAEISVQGDAIPQPIATDKEAHFIGYSGDTMIWDGTYLNAPQDAALAQTIRERHEMVENISLQENGKIELSTLQYHLLDATGDGKVDIQDAYVLLGSYAKFYVSGDPAAKYFAPGRYDLYPDGVNVDVVSKDCVVIRVAS